MRHYYVKVYGQPVPVSKAVYTAYYKAWRRERYLEERDEKHGLFSYHALDTDDFQGESIIVDPHQTSVEDVVIHAMMLDKLREVLRLLRQEDMQLLLLLFGDLSERRLVKMLGIPRTTLQRKRLTLIEYLKNLLEK